ncbi:MAG: NADP-dependent oxidoreductase [Acidobacteria bacterium]|nr:NADP-dependent oxidoreductase [Acidobacteriota bacterium]
MKAMRIHEYGGIDALKQEEIAKPQPAADEVLVKVQAASVNPVDWKISEGFGEGWLGYTLPHTLGCDVAGVVEAVGRATQKLHIGAAVFGYTNLAHEGTYAEYVLAKESEVTTKPAALDFIHAAAVPVSSLTAWQALFDIAGLAAGQKVLIHAAAGGVGSMAVQLAKVRGAVVIGTASARNADFVKGLGADEVIDYTTTRFEDAVQEVDVVFDLIGGDTQQRSYAVLKQGGILVSAVQPPDEAACKAARVRGEMVGVQPNASQLEEIKALIEAGKVNVSVEKVLPLDDAKQALTLSKQGRTRGKIVLTVA